MDTKITAAIVDDEQGNRENLLRMIGNYCPQIRISAICSSVSESRYTNWPPALQQQFAVARAVDSGKPSFTLSLDSE